jgi:hypothetical protein
MHIRIGTAAVLAVCVAAGAGCNKKYLSFNESISGANKKLEAAGKKFGEALVQAITSGNDTGAVRTSYENVKSVFTAVKAEMQALAVPNDATSKELYQAHQKFLAGQEKAINVDLAQVVKLVEDKSTPLAAKGGQITSLLSKIEAEENRELATLQQVQRKFADAHNMKLR